MRLKQTSHKTSTISPLRLWW